MGNQRFFWDAKNNLFYLVNFQEGRYFEIDKDSPFHRLCMHLYCGAWDVVKRDIESNYKKCVRIEQIDGTEDL
ncbi:hypothetical protein [Bacillus paranthracis]|uniref:hypothetical protein n=1 Tax=Bacillus paranthracis TaxID=2026186 RepID=UPI0029C2DD9A|nr:hypothetical protein [Bacillus paranthracis]MDX6046732.1 hypothetical protein [Bacillus paranthracis]